MLRRLGVALPGLTPKTGERRPQRPGQHGAARRRLRRSDYEAQLVEKQKLRFYYGLRESQLARYVERAGRRHGPTDALLLGILESRLDNVVFRLGLTVSIPAARQLVVHGHVQVDGRRVHAPGYELRAGQTVRLREQAHEQPHVTIAVARGPQLQLPSWLERDADGFGGRLVSPPDFEGGARDVKLPLVIEYYSR